MNEHVEWKLTNDGQKKVFRCTGCGLEIDFDTHSLHSVEHECDALEKLEYTVQRINEVNL